MKRPGDPTSAGDAGEKTPASASVPIFTPIVAPKVTSISHAALNVWKRERREYEAKMKARCRTTGENYDKVVEMVKESFDSDLLDTFCEYRLGCTSDEATDTVLLDEINKIVGTIKNNDTPDVKALFRRELRMNMKESDIDARVIDYFKRFSEVVEEHGLKAIFEYADGRKEKCKRLAASLHPPALKNDVKRAIRYTNKGAGQDPKLLYKLVLEKATEFERHFQQSKKAKVAAADVESPASKYAPGSGKKKAFSNRPRSAKKDRDVKVVSDKKESAKPPPSPCPKCNTMHWIRDCPVATEAEKAEMQRKLREAREKKRAQRLKRFSEYLPEQQREVTINGVLSLPYCADSGSERTVICRSHWDELRAQDPSVSARQLESPLKQQAYGRRVFVANLEAALHLRLHTAAGPVELEELVPCLIVDTEDDEFIVGRDVLTSLGIDVDRQLEMLAKSTDGDIDGDPFELEADEPVVNPVKPVVNPIKSVVNPVEPVVNPVMPAVNRIRPDVTPHEPSGTAITDEEVRAAVETMIQRAVANGFPDDKVEKLRTIVHMYDVWRLELRNDPPARVPPLEIHLKEGAQPSK